jgi:hypothetical protein
MLERWSEGATTALASRTTRRSFLGRLGAGIVALAGGPFVAEALRPERASAYHLCGHLFTTGSCPHPFHPRTRIDKYGYPVHPKYGYPVDNKGRLYKSKKQKRDRVCQERVPRKYPYVKNPRYGGGWSRCCKGRIRRIADCCSTSRKRINGDASVRGYCYGATRVFCIGYRDTNVRC